MKITAFEFPFIRDGFTHELLERDGLVYLVKRSKPEHWHYEVVRLQIAPAQSVFGKFYPAHERYPGNEQWGTHGFTYDANRLDMAGKRAQWLKNLGSNMPAMIS